MQSGCLVSSSGCASSVASLISAARTSSSQRRKMRGFDFVVCCESYSVRRFRAATGAIRSHSSGLQAAAPLTCERASKYEHSALIKRARSRMCRSRHTHATTYKFAALSLQPAMLILKSVHERPWTQCGHSIVAIGDSSHDYCVAYLRRARRAPHRHYATGGVSCQWSCHLLSGICLAVARSAFRTRY